MQHRATYALWVLLRNAAVAVGVQQMETFTKLSFTPHHAAANPLENFFVMSGAKSMAEIEIFYNNIYT